MIRKVRRYIVQCLTIVPFSVLLWMLWSWGIDRPVNLLVTEQGLPQAEQPVGLTVEKALTGMDSHMKQLLESRFRSRGEKLEKACAKNPLSYSLRNDIKTFKYGKVTMCIPTKIGSMFWKAYRKNYNKDLKRKSETGGIFSFVFVRDPYTRLLSAYVDKIFSPNPTFWAGTGKHAYLLSHPHVDKNFRCGFNVTFSEFVRFVLKGFESIRALNEHFRPIHKQCYFCHKKYSIIGKMETFMEDMLYISEKIKSLQFNNTRQFIADSKNASENMIHINLYHCFGNRRRPIEECGVSLIQALKMNWRRWQIRGFIEPRFPFPLGDSDSNITREKFEEYALNARAMSDKKKLSEAKQQALRQAYSTVSIENKHRLKEMFYPQFEMFGYDPMPDYLFGNYSNPVDGFDFFEKISILGYCDNSDGMCR